MHDDFKESSITSNIIANGQVVFSNQAAVKLVTPKYIFSTTKYLLSISKLYNKKFVSLLYKFKRPTLNYLNGKEIDPTKVYDKFNKKAADFLLNKCCKVIYD